MQASFDIDAPGAPLDEAAAVAALARGEPPEGPPLMGSLHLAGNDATLDIHDDLQFLVPSLCLRAPRNLAAGTEAKVDMASWPQSYTLRREGDAVLVLERGEAELARLPYHALAEALSDCARRFTAYVGGLATLDPRWRPLHGLLQRELAA